MLLPSTLVLLLMTVGLLLLPMQSRCQTPPPPPPKPLSFSIPEFLPTTDTVEINGGTKKLGIPGAVLGNGSVSLTAGNVQDLFCAGILCMGRVFYKTAAVGRGISFNTKFTFSMEKSRTNQETGDGFIFFLSEHPNFQGGLPNGRFGAFADDPKLAQANFFFAIEFDTMLNTDLLDNDSNHVGVDLSSPMSVKSVRADLVNVTLNDGKKIVAWIDYDKAQNRVEARIKYDDGDHVKPTDPLLSHIYNLDDAGMTNYHAGFSSSSNLGFEQRHVIYNWEFSAQFETDLVQNGTSWVRIVAYVCGGVVGGGLIMCCVVRFTECGRRRQEFCMKNVTLKQFMAKIRKKQEAADDEAEKAKPGNTAINDDDENHDNADDDDEKDNDDGTKDEDAEEEEDDNDDQCPPPPPPGGFPPTHPGGSPAPFRPGGSPAPSRPGKSPAPSRPGVSPATSRPGVPPAPSRPGVKSPPPFRPGGPPLPSRAGVSPPLPGHPGGSSPPFPSGGFSVPRKGPPPPTK